MSDELELEGLLFEEDEKPDFLIEQESLGNSDKLTERWASWVDVVDK